MMHRIHCKVSTFHSESNAHESGYAKRLFNYDELAKGTEFNTGSTLDTLS